MFRRGLERQIRTLKNQNVESIFRMIRMSEDQNVKNQNVKKNIESQKMTFNFLIFFDFIGIIRTLKVLVHFLTKNTFDVLILPMASKKIRTFKLKRSTTYGVLPMCTKAYGGLG
jgi:hypothetical protein